MPYNEVLDAAIEQAGFKHQQAEIAGASADRLEALQARINHLGLRRRDAIAFDRELNEAADLFSQGRPVPHLILSSKEYPDGLSRFITTSVYHWAKSVHGRNIPEWAPPDSPTQNEGDDPPACSAAAALIAPEAPEDRWSHPDTAHRNLRFTVHIVAHSLAGLIDQLAGQDYINFNVNHTCIDEHQAINVRALCDYLTSALDLPPETSGG
jgi:hypothetical protein